MFSVCNRLCCKFILALLLSINVAVIDVGGTLLLTHDMLVIHPILQPFIKTQMTRTDIDHSMFHQKKIVTRVVHDDDDDEQ